MHHNRGYLQGHLIYQDSSNFLFTTPHSDDHGVVIVEMDTCYVFLLKSDLDLWCLGLAFVQTRGQILYI